ncbi:MAG: T9SS type A sorting domain-containing protein [Bacteroidaceae bacterium]|jgi:hypothetical protein|nr:T9SS type A sorting domain-containing protein [Bacteroidaceae bacterium]
MKTKNILAAMLLMVSANMMADEYEYKYLTVSYGNNSEESISLPTVQKITFEEGFVVVATTDGNFKFPISIMDKMTFTETATAIEALPEEAKGVTYKDGTLAIKGDGLLRIYNTGGALVNIANVKEGANISLGNLPAGVYIVRMGDKVIKVRK